jgi:hypothetical protein
MESARIGILQAKNHHGSWRQHGLTPQPLGRKDWGIGLRYAGTDWNVNVVV